MRPIKENITGRKQATLKCPLCNHKLDPEKEDASMVKYVCNVGSCDVLHVVVIKRRKRQ